MYATHLMTALVALSTASAVVLPRQVIDPEPLPYSPSGSFNITSFSVANPPGGSLYTYYTLNVTDPAGPTPLPSNISTICHTTTDTTPAISGFANLTCDDPSVKWSLTNNGTGYLLEIKHNWGIEVQHAIVKAYDNITDTARAYFPNCDVKNSPTAPEGKTALYLDAPSSFNLQYDRYIL
ncbi:hypothetical protein D0Z07_8970 [Hyphodiscus hymeniophilus]|uniref:AA1-like domain-containing protein n=1 Tax=Hyphodiscus hymeniophilus TaxID=353542 RepID=A0A9P6SQQ6_9HELO|nr:hypothetical protein D0Z07_8970 [Hyphodiscus hymeniophilus]